MRKPALLLLSLALLPVRYNAAAQNPVRVSQGVMDGHCCVTKTAPVYSPEALAAGVQGSASLLVNISAAGVVTPVKGIAGNPALVAMAMDTVRQWKYRPYLLNGAPVDVQTTVSVDFRMSPADRQRAPQVIAQAKAQQAAAQAAALIPRKTAACDPANPGNVSGATAFAYAKDKTKNGNTDEGTRCWLYVAATGGDALAQARYGYFLHNGLGGPKDDHEGFIWTLRSAEQGEKYGMIYLVAEYLNGIGTPKDPQKAEFWIKRAMQNPDVAKMITDASAKNQAAAQQRAAQASDVQAELNRELLGLVQQEQQREAKLTPEEKKEEARRADDLFSSMDDFRCSGYLRGTPGKESYCAALDRKWAQYEADRKAKQQ